MFPSLPEDLMRIFFKIQFFSATKIEEIDNRIIVEAEKTVPGKCPVCGKVCEKRKDSTTQEILIGSILGRAVYCRIKVSRVVCFACGIKTENNGISEGKKRYSEAVAEDVIRHTELLDNESAASLLGLSRSNVYRIDREKLGTLFERYRDHVPPAKRISIDEYARKKGHNYATSVADYDKGVVIWIEEGRKAEDLERAYDNIKESLKGVEQVSVDLWPAYEKATVKKLPEAHIVYDRFHIARLLNKAVEEERRDYQKQLSDEERIKMKKHSRWILLKRSSNLSEGNKKHLEELKKQNSELYEVYLLKEDFLSLFEEGKPADDAEKEIKAWIATVLDTKYANLKTFARSILKRLSKVVNWFKNPISNGKMEGINNKIKTVMRRAYGYKDFEYMRLKILQKCGLLMNMRFHTF